ncbi:Spo11/DNA topoisomerase VI subunit A [Elsinoe ampelina]|uniref:DNA topoisomerase (ATP-hydrolyzing) n=1 Tax=Elsinoe ampelina TaxID=302913 RepID=A0A6A6G513_9PEZI|nr:Spo11/DNA topoisomerase VI subunit A [Elsinoe ampelina]
MRPAVVLKIMDQVKGALSTGSVVSKRDVYYHDPALFGTQATVDRHIDLIAAALGVKRSDLNVCAAAKGLIAGAAEFHYKDGTVHKLLDDTVPQLIGSSDELLAVCMEKVRIILVVEKEASFQDLLMTSTWHDIKDRAIVLTGKGYPDLATRRLLHLLAHPSPTNHFASPPVYLLSDFDPDGIAIAQTYKHGSLKLQHEGQGIQTPQARRLGLSRKHVTDLPGSFRSQTLLPMTVGDRRKAQNMLKRMVDHEDMVEDMVDLQFMLMMNVKAELQSLNEGQGGLDHVLATAIKEEQT